MIDDINWVAETTEEMVQLLAIARKGDRLAFTYRNEQRAHVEAVMDSYLTGYDTVPTAKRDLVLWFRDVERDDEGRPPYGKVHYSAPREPALKHHLSVYGYTEDPPRTQGLKWHGELLSFERRLSCVGCESGATDVFSNEKTGE